MLVVTTRDEKTLDIGTALGCLVVVLVGGYALMFLADRSVGLSDDVAARLSIAIPLAACLAAVAYLVRVRRHRAARRESTIDAS